MLVIIFQTETSTMKVARLHWIWPIFSCFTVDFTVLKMDAALQLNLQSWKWTLLYNRLHSPENGSCFTVDFTVLKMDAALWLTSQSWKWTLLYSWLQSWKWTLLYGWLHIPENGRCFAVDFTVLKMDVALRLTSQFWKLTLLYGWLHSPQNGRILRFDFAVLKMDTALKFNALSWFGFTASSENGCMILSKGSHLQLTQFKLTDIVLTFHHVSTSLVFIFR